MAEPLDESYFNWLCAKVMPRNSNTYFDLMEILYTTEFVWVISGDENRAEDGIELRTFFLTESGLEADEEWLRVGCSILEMLLAFSNRASFQTDISAKDWFWEFITNLGLEEYRQVSNSDRELIDDILYRFVWRTYDFNGVGGMHPLRWPKHDQRHVEIWYQFCEYLEEQGRL